MKIEIAKDSPPKVWATVVTYNRIEKLRECITALRAQTFKPEMILVINNGSTDETENWLKAQSDLLYVTQENSGSAGGQYRAVKTAYEADADWIWTMDDDVIPDQDALKELLNARSVVRGEIGFLCSCVVDASREYMVNVPQTSNNPSGGYYSQWPKYLDKGLAQVSNATFVSILINCKVVRTIGYPIKEFFIWGDDSEYTIRISNKYSSYCVGKSVVRHMRKFGKGLDFFTESDTGRLEMYYYKYRNTLYLHRICKRSYVWHICITILNLIKLLALILIKRKRLRHARIAIMSHFAAIGFNPKIEFPRSV